MGLGSGSGSSVVPMSGENNGNVRKTLTRYNISYRAILSCTVLSTLSNLLHISYSAHILPSCYLIICPPFSLVFLALIDPLIPWTCSMSLFSLFFPTIYFSHSLHENLKSFPRLTHFSLCSAGASSLLSPASAAYDFAQRGLRGAYVRTVLFSVVKSKVSNYTCDSVVLFLLFSLFPLLLSFSSLLSYLLLLLYLFLLSLSFFLFYFFSPLLFFSHLLYSLTFYCPPCQDTALLRIFDLYLALNHLIVCYHLLLFIAPSIQSPFHSTTSSSPSISPISPNALIRRF